VTRDPEMTRALTDVHRMTDRRVATSTSATSPTDGTRLLLLLADTAAIAPDLLGMQESCTLQQDCHRRGRRGTVRLGRPADGNSLLVREPHVRRHERLVRRAAVVSPGARPSWRHPSPPRGGRVAARMADRRLVAARRCAAAIAVMGDRRPPRAGRMLRPVRSAYAGRTAPSQQYVSGSRPRATDGGPTASTTCARGRRRGRPRTSTTSRGRRPTLYPSTTGIVTDLTTY
jgi:hypothetical protein